MTTMTEQTPVSDSHRRGATFTLSEAATACGVSMSTVVRRRRADAFPNAWRDQAGTWRIPVSDLLAAGLTPGRPAAERSAEDVTPASDRAVDELDAEARETIARLEAELAAERTARQLAEAKASVYERVQDDLRVALRALSAAPPPPALSAAPAPAQAEPEPVRRRWWQRG